MTTRTLLIHALTTTFNLSNLALYINSPDEFNEHYGRSNHRLSNGNVGEKCLFAFIFIVAFTTQGYSNQKTYFKNITAYLKNKSFCNLLPSPETQNQNTPPPNKFLALFAALYKAGVTCSSLTALLKNQHFNTKVLITIAVLCAPGNVASQYAIYTPQFLKKYTSSLQYGWRLLISHLAVLSYNLPNTALYFNAGNGFFKHINQQKHRLTDANTFWEYVSLTLLAVGSLSLLISTQREYTKRVLKVLTDPNENTQNECKCMGFTNISLFSMAVSLESTITPLYKTVVTSLSLITLTFTITNSLIAGIATAALCFPGNAIAQFSLFKSNKTALSYKPIEEYKSKAWFFGLFGETRVKETKGFGINIDTKHSLS